KIATRYLDKERNKTVPGMAHEQNDFSASKLLFWDQVFSADSVPKVAFGPVFETIMGKDEPGNTGLAVTFRLEGEFAAITFAEIGTKKCSNPGTSAFGNGKD